MIQTPGVGFNGDNNSLHISRMMAQTTSGSRLAASPQRLTPSTVNLDSVKAALSSAVEHLTVDVSIATADMSISFSGTASFTPSASDFTVDLSFLYFDVVVVSSDGTSRTLSAGDMSFRADVGAQQFAMIVSPGSRSGGHGLLGAVRSVSDKLADAAIRAMQVNHDSGAKAQDSARREAQAASLRAALSHATRQAGKSRSVKSQAPEAAITPQVATAAFASFAAMASDRASQKHRAAVAATDKYHNAKGISNSNKITLRFNEDGIKGHLAVTRTNDLAKYDGGPGLFLDSSA